MICSHSFPTHKERSSQESEYNCMTYSVRCSGALASIWLRVRSVRMVRMYMYNLLVFGMHIRFVRF